MTPFTQRLVEAIGNDVADVQAALAEALEAGLLVQDGARFSRAPSAPLTFPLNLTEPPPLGTKLRLRREDDLVAVLIEARAYTRKTDGAPSFVLLWRKPDGGVVSTGLKARGGYRTWRGA